MNGPIGRRIVRAVLCAAAMAMPAAVLAQPCAPDLPKPPFVMPTTGQVFTLPPVESTEPPCPAEPPQPVRPPPPDLFGMAALAVTAVPVSRNKWDSARGVNLADVEGSWSELLAQITDPVTPETLDRVNMWVNWHVGFRDDPGADEWSDAVTTFTRGYGDCEDYAIGKMALLAASGVPSDDMFLVLLRDRKAQDHAVLAVRLSGTIHVLDNRTDRLLTADQIADYTPTLSFSGPFAWTYGVRLR